MVRFQKLFSVITFVGFNWKQVNTFKLCAELGSTLSFEQKKDGLYLHAYEMIPYALTFRDMRLLSVSNDKYAHYNLAKILYLYPKAFSDTNTAVNTLFELFIPVLTKSVLDGNFLRGLHIENPGNNGYAERVFNVCCYLSMQCDDGDIAEKKLAMFLCRLFDHFYQLPPMIKLITVMATAFARGHFMNIPAINAYIEEIYNNYSKMGA